MEAAPGLPKRRTCAALGDPQLWEWREESVASEQRNGKRDALASSQGQHPRKVHVVCCGDLNVPPQPLKHLLGDLDAPEDPIAVGC